MKTYARVDNGIVWELFSTDGNMAEMFHPAIVWADVTGLSPCPQQGWAAVEVDGVWKFTPAV